MKKKVAFFEKTSTKKLFLYEYFEFGKYCCKKKGYFFIKKVKFFVEVFSKKVTFFSHHFSNFQKSPISPILQTSYVKCVLTFEKYFW